MIFLECVEYDNDTGRILCHYTVTEDIFEYMVSQGVHLLKGAADANTQYVDVSVNPPVLAERPAQSTTQDKTEIQADGVDTMTLVSLPSPCSVNIGGETYVVQDGVFSWGTVDRGTYPFVVTAFPYLDFEGTVEAT